MKKIFVPILGMLILFSCKEDDAPVKSKTDLICASPWKITAATVDPPLDIGGTQISDWYTQLESCDKDNLTKYESNKSGLDDEGATKCDPSDPQSTPFLWTFDLSETTLTEDGVSYEMIELNESTLKLATTIDGENIGGATPGVKYKFTATYKH